MQFLVSLHLCVSQTPTLPLQQLSRLMNRRASLISASFDKKSDCRTRTYFFLVLHSFEDLVLRHNVSHDCMYKTIYMVSKSTHHGCLSSLDQDLLTSAVI